MHAKHAAVACTAWATVCLGSSTVQLQADEAQPLRHEALCHAGWIAGNARGHEGWDAIKGQFSRSGEQVEDLAGRGEAPEDVVINRMAVFEACWKRGRSKEHNPDAVKRRIKRFIEIRKTIMKRLKEKREKIRDELNEATRDAAKE